MNVKLHNSILILEVDKRQEELKVKEQIKSLRRSLDALEGKLENSEKVYDSGGIHGVVGNIDSSVNKIVAFNRAIELLKSE